MKMNKVDLSFQSCKSTYEEADVFKLIATLIVASEAEGVACDNASLLNNPKILSLHKERLESLRGCLLLLFDTFLDGNLDARKRALEYVAETGVEVHEKFLAWLWGENRDIFKFDSLAHPEWPTRQ